MIREYIANLCTQVVRAVHFHQITGLSISYFQNSNNCYKMLNNRLLASNYFIDKF